MNIFRSKKNNLKDNNIIVGDMNRKSSTKKHSEENLADVVEHKPQKNNLRLKVDRYFSKNKRFMSGLFVIILVISVVALGFLLFSKLDHVSKDDIATKKVLTVSDLEKPNVELTSNTSNASVENLTKELRDMIDKQIVAKENPIETVNQLAAILSSTTNEKRQDQLTSFLEDFLAKYENSLWFSAESGTPNQAQVNYWKAELYAKLVYNYRFMMLNKFIGSNGKPINTTKEQLKYIDLYLALANDPKSHIVVSEKDKDFLIDYQYNEANNFLKLKNELNAGQYNG